MDKKMALPLVVALLLSFVFAGSVSAQGEQDQDNLKTIIKNLDTSITYIRKVDNTNSTSVVSSASSVYKSTFSTRVANVDSALDNRILTAFESLSQWALEDNVFALRADVLQAAGLLGVSLSPIYVYPMFVILGIAVLVALSVTLVNKRLVNWELVRANKAKVAEFNKELKEARVKRDTKLMHKVQQRQGEIMKLQWQITQQTMKPTILYMIPLILLYLVIGGIYSGWVVVWLPFNITLPIFGQLIAFGFGWWYFLTYMGLSTIFRKIMIRD